MKRLALLTLGFVLLLAAPAAAQQRSAEIDPDPGDFSAQTAGPAQSTFTIRNTGVAFTGRLRGSDLGAVRRQRPTIASLAQHQVPIVVPPGTTRLTVRTGNTSDPAADLDLFLFNCTTGSCVQAGSSADADAEEYVRVDNPAEGTWIALIDGFAVPAGTTEYDVADALFSAAYGTLSVASVDEEHPPGSTWSEPATWTPSATPVPAGRELIGEVSVTTSTNQLVAHAPAFFRIDTTPPDTTIAGPALLGPAVTLDLQSTEPRSTFLCQVDAEPPTACTSPWRLPAISEGAHALTVVALDPAGNPDPTAARHEFTVDLTPPRTTLTAAPAGAVRDRTPSVAFTADDAGATFACRVDGGAFAPCSSPFTAPELDDAAEHAIEVRATDPVGNHGFARSVFTVTAPSALGAATAEIVGGRATPSAVLTHWRTGAPVAGREVAFSASGAAICTATTDAAGVATCSGPVAAAGEYVAAFGGDAAFGATTARGALSLVSGSCARPSELTLRVSRGTKGLRVRKSLRGARVTRAELRKGKRRVRTLTVRGKRVLVDLRGLSAGTYTVRATVRLKGGKRVRASRRVSAC